MYTTDYIREDMEEVKPTQYDEWIEYINSTNRLGYEDKTYEAVDWKLLRKSIKSYAKFKSQRDNTNSVIRYKDMVNRIAYAELKNRFPVIAEMKFNTSQTGIRNEFAAPKIKLIFGRNGKRYSICRIHRAKGGFITIQPNGKRRVFQYEWADVMDIRWVDLPVDLNIGRTYASKRMVITVEVD